MRRRAAGWCSPYVREDFIDGRAIYNAPTLYRRTRQRSQLWQFGLMPEDVGAFLAGYGWQLIEQAGPDYMLEHYVRPAGRNLRASQIEWSAYAQVPSPESRGTPEHAH